MDNKDVILQFSGGKDSFLSACRLIESGYHVKMAAYNNGCMKGCSNITETASRIMEKYGQDKARFLGIFHTAGIAREFFSPYFNMQPKQQLEKFPGITPSQCHCLICRTAMYIHTIWLAQRKDVKYIATGDRKSKEFVVQKPEMVVNRYSMLAEKSGLELLTPVYDIDSNWDRNNELLRRGYLPETMEPECLIGMSADGNIDISVISGTCCYYDNCILPKIEELDFLLPETAKQHRSFLYNES